MEKIKMDEVENAGKPGTEEIGTMKKVEGSICELVAIRGEIENAIKSDKMDAWILFDKGKLPKNIEKIVKQIEMQKAKEQGCILRIKIKYIGVVCWLVEVWELIP